jgi:hypothetical protein
MAGRVSAAPAALVWSASSSDPQWVRAPVTRGIFGTARCRRGGGRSAKEDQEPAGPSPAHPRFVLAAGGGALLASRSRQRPLLGAAVSIGGSLVGVYDGLPWRTWAAGKFGRDAYGAVAEDAPVLGAAVLSVRQERRC